MRKLLSLLVIGVMLLSAMPAILAEEGSIGGGVNVNIGNENDAPKICTDVTDRCWYPNDQTIYTARIYDSVAGTASSTNDYGDSCYNVDLRGNYVFAGETLTYYVVVKDADGDDDIENVILTKDGVGVGSCSEITQIPEGLTDLSGFDCSSSEAFDDATMNLYRCVMIVQSEWAGLSEVKVNATDESNARVSTTWSDQLTMNPDLKVSLGGSINFGSAEPGDSVTSNSIYLKNDGSDGVAMDMYIASDDYFTDPSNPTAICGIGNGIPYTAFSYYATKGSLDSGDNNNAFPGLGETATGLCIAEADEFTELPSHSGHIEDMCRIINHQKGASVLVQGQSMSLTFQLEVPTPCEGNFNNGQFHFVGRVI